jgi:alpha-galactosidase
MQVWLHEGRVELIWPGRATTGPLRPRVVLESGVEHIGDVWRRDGDAVTAPCGPLTLRLRVRAGARDRARLTIEATARAAVEVVEVGLQAEPLIGGAEPAWLAYSGYQSWDASGVAPARPHDAAPRQSWWTLGLAGGDGSGLALCALTARSASTRFEYRSGSLLIAAEEPGGLQLRPVLWSARRGDTWRADPISISAGEDVWAQLRGLAAQVRSRRRGAVPRGWLSWYHYGPWVSAEDVLENAAVIQRGPLTGLDYSIIQVDDGWQELYGDWVPNEKFPGGLSAVAAELGKHGQVLGVWTAPFLVSSTSQLAGAAPDSWFVPDPVTGRRAVDPNHLVFGPMNILDARNPAVRRHLRDTFARLRADGVRYFKIDFLYAGGYAGTRALRMGIEAIRRGAGDDAYLLACGAPLLPMVGVCEGCRIGRDTATPVFDFELGGPKPTLIADELADVARNQGARHFLDSWFHLDPDVALVGGNLTFEQARACVTFCALSGGPFFASDHLTALPPDRLALLTNRDVLALVGGRAAVPDWPPTAADQAGVWRRNGVVAAFNWDRTSHRMRVPIDRPARATDLWSGVAIGRVETAVELEIPPQGVRLIRLDEG